MNFINKLERKLGRYAINNLSLYIVLAYGIGYLLTLTGSVEFICLNPYLIFHGQVWRIISWVLVPPSSFDLFTIIMLFFYYSIGTALERTWGTFKYNLYIFSGILFSIIGAIVLYFIYCGMGLDGAMAGTVVSRGFSTYYINLSIFLAFALTYPNTQVLLFFVIPIRMKWMAIVYAIMVGYDFIIGRTGDKIAIGASLLNFVIFFLLTRNYKRYSPGEIHRRRKFKSQTATNSPNVSKHKCAVCGRTEKDGDNLEFRFCSKCNGNYEYCQDHLFTHEHIK